MRIPVAVPTLEGRQLGAVIEKFEQSQWWSTEALERYQFSQLEALLGHAYETVPFYRERLGGAGYRPGQAITPEFWKRLPLLERRDLQDQRDALRSTRIPAEHIGSYKVSTSGSTAMPVSLWRTRLQALMLSAVVLRKLLWQSCDFQLKLGVVMRDRDNRPFSPVGRRYADWNPPSSLVFQTGPATVLGSQASAAEIAEWLLREQPNYLRIVPTLLKELSFHFLDRKLELPQLKGIMCSGEVVGSDLRELTRETFGLGVFASYGASEVGTIALQCPMHEHYHVQAETALVEVLDAEGMPCASGETGTVIVTPLQGFATPLIRYVVGDRAIAGAPCPCGRPHPVLQQVAGRMRDQIMLPSGARRYCYVGGLAFWQFRDIRQFQLVQRSLHDLEVKLVVRQPLTEEVKVEVARRVKTATSEHFSVALTYHDSIPLTAGGKFQDLVCEVETTAAPVPGL
jgi:phenylacetate-CoA ligase